MATTRLAVRKSQRGLHFTAYTMVSLGATTPSVTRGAELPDWLMADPLGVCPLTRAAVLWWANLAGAFVHCALAVAALLASARDGRSVDTPRLPVYLTKLDWNPNGTQVGLVPTFNEGGTLPLTWLAFTFFGMSALAHAVICAFNYPFGPLGARFRGWEESFPPRGWYYLWLQECRQPLRWIEYSFSASVMMVTIAFVTGISHIYTLSCIFFLMWCTQCFGYFTEELSRPQKTGNVNERPRTWERREWYVRLRPHFLGYVPYSAAWFTLIHSFYWNYLNTRDGRRAPDFVHWIVWGQFAVFSLFGITQLLNQGYQNGPYWYWRGELSYVVLSLTAKALLGGLLIANVLMYDSFDAAVSAGVEEASDAA